MFKRQEAEFSYQLLMGALGWRKYSLLNVSDEIYTAQMAASGLAYSLVKDSVWRGNGKQCREFCEFAAVILRRTTMTLILVMDNDCAIGRGGDLLCRLPADMKHFRETTKGSTVIMGRKTYESFPKRPLPDRENLILSRTMESAEGARVFKDINSLMEYVKGKERVFVIGGGEIYKQLAPFCGEALITRVYENFGGDVFFEDIERSPEWKLVEASVVVETLCRNIRLLRFLRKK